MMHLSSLQHSKLYARRVIDGSCSEEEIYPVGGSSKTPDVRLFSWWTRNKPPSADRSVPAASAIAKERYFPVVGRIADSHH